MIEILVLSHRQTKMRHCIPSFLPSASLRTSNSSGVSAPSARTQANIRLLAGPASADNSGHDGGRPAPPLSSGLVKVLKPPQMIPLDCRQAPAYQGVLASRSEGVQA